MKWISDAYKEIAMASNSAKKHFIELTHISQPIQYQINPNKVSDVYMEKNMESGDLYLRFTAYDQELSEILQIHGCGVEFHYLGEKFTPKQFTINQNVGDYKSVEIEAVMHQTNYPFAQLPKKVMFESPYKSLEVYDTGKGPYSIKAKIPSPKHEFKGYEPYFVGSNKGVPSDTGRGRLYVVMYGAVMVRMELQEALYKSGVTGTDTNYIGMRVTASYPRHQSISQIHHPKVVKKVSEYDIEGWEICGAIIQPNKTIEAFFRFHGQDASESSYTFKVNNGVEFPSYAFTENPHDDHQYEPTVEYWVDYTTSKGEFLKREKTKKRLNLYMHSPFYKGETCCLMVAEVSESGIIKRKMFLGANSLKDHEKKTGVTF